MAQMPQQQQHQYPPPPPPPPQSFSPSVPSPSPTSASPVNGAIPPPPKRQRLSPHPSSQPQSPYASPSFGTLQLPQNQPPPTNGTNVNGLAPTQSSQPQSAMGPPSRPADKATDAAELTDVLASSGIDVREEEAFLTSSYRPSVQAQQAQQPQQLPPNLSFASQTSTAGTTSTTPSFTDPSQFKPASQSFYSEPSTQPPPFKDPNEPTRADSQAAARAQHHLQEPFLLTKVLEQRLQKRGIDLGVRIPSEGLFHPVPGRPQPIEVTGPDGSSVVRTGQTILNQEGAPLVDILNLMSISCEERLRNVIDYSAVLARSRRAHSHGGVPADWKDLAVPGGNAEGSKTLKRPHAALEPRPAKPLADKFRFLMEKEAAQEDKRASKRAKRNANAILGEGGNKANSGDVSGASTPVGERAPGLERKGMTKKEQRKMMDARVSEAQQHQQSVETARMATNSMLSGSLFGTKKSYSWLNLGQSTPSGFSTPSRVNTATPSGGDTGGRPGEPAVMPAKRLGGWREDREKGAGIQVRDLLFMLEMDGRGRRHVQKAYARDVKEDRQD